MLGILKNIFGRNPDELNQEETAAKRRLQKLRDKRANAPSQTGEGEEAVSSFKDMVQAKSHEPGVSPFKVWTGIEGKAQSVGVTNSSMVRPFKGGAFGFSENPMRDDIDQFNRENFAESSEKKKSQSDLGRAALANLLARHGQIVRNLDPEPGSSGQFDVVTNALKDTVLASEWSANDSLFSGTGLYCEYSDTVTLPARTLRKDGEQAKCFGPPIDLNELEKPKPIKPAHTAALEEDYEFVDEVLFHYDNSESLFDGPEILATGLPETSSDNVSEQESIQTTQAALTAELSTPAQKNDAMSSPVGPQDAAVGAVSKPTSPGQIAAAAKAAQEAAKEAAKEADARAAAEKAASQKAAAAMKTAEESAAVPTSKIQKAPNKTTKGKGLTRIEDPSSAPRTKEEKKNLLLSDLCDSRQIKQFSHPYDRFSESSLKLIAQNPKTPSGALSWLAAHRDPHIRAAVAKNPSTPIETYWVLARDHEASIRYSIAENLYMRPEILRELSRDRNPLIATTAQASLHSVRETLMNALPPSSLFEKKNAADTAEQKSTELCAEGPQKPEQLGDEEFLLMIANKSTTPPRRLKDLANHAQSAIRASVASNPNTPAEVLWLMARDADPTVKIKLAGNCNLPEEILDILKEDKDSFVAKAALKVQNKLAELRFTGDLSRNEVRHILTWP